MSKRYISDYREAGDFVKADHPKKLSEAEAEKLGQGEDLDDILLDLEEKPNFAEKKDFFRINKGDYVAYKPAHSNQLASLKKLNLPNLFLVTNVYHSEAGQVILAIKNDKDRKYRLRGQEDDFQLITHENNRSGT